MAVWAFRGRPETGQRPVVRGDPFVPSPAPSSRAAYYLRVMAGGDQSKHPAVAQAKWRLFGEAPLRQLGPEALDHVLAEERFAQYRATPNLLANVLRMLPGIEGFRFHARLRPFLLHWLDPANCPPAGPGADWASDLRRLVFQLLVLAPDPSMAPFCEEELRATARVHDLRKEAIDVLVQGGRGDLLAPLYASLPPNEAEPGPPYLRHYVLDQLYRQAAAGPEGRERARVLEPVARDALRSDAPGESVRAAGLLLRLGDDSMEDHLLDLFERDRSGPEEAGAYSALLLAVENRSGRRARDLCLGLMEGDKAAFVAPILVGNWGEEAEVREKVWRYVEASERLPPNALAGLARHDRPRAVAHVRARITASAGAERAEAVRFAGQMGMRELAPDILDLAKRTDDESERALHYATLARLAVPEVVPLMRHELGRSGELPEWRRTLATNLLQLGGDAVEAVAAALEERDEAVLAAVVARASEGGRGALPDRLVDPLLRAVREMPGEGGRTGAVVALRCRGVLGDVRDGLVDAYRREPSSRVAREIAEALEDLAHR